MSAPLPLITFLSNRPVHIPSLLFPLFTNKTLKVGFIVCIVVCSHMVISNIPLLKKSYEIWINEDDTYMEDSTLLASFHLWENCYFMLLEENHNQQSYNEQLWILIGVIMTVPVRYVHWCNSCMNFIGVTSFWLDLRSVPQNGTTSDTIIRAHDLWLDRS